MRLLKDDLRELDLFSEASRSELAVIAKQLTRLKVKAGRVLVREGGLGNEFMIIVDRLRVDGGREVLEAHHPTTGDKMTLFIDELEGIEVVK